MTIYSYLFSIYNISFPVVTNLYFISKLFIYANILLTDIISAK